MPAIVQVNVTQTLAPSPNTLQQTGAMLSQGGTNTSPGTLTLLTQSASLTNNLTVAKALTSISQSAGLATAVAPTAHGFPAGAALYITIAGANQAAYNGTFLCTVTTTADFTFAVPSGTTSPATGTITYIPDSANELAQMNTTFFAQGGSTACYVLELGAGSVADGVVFLTNWIAQNPPGIAQANGFWGVYSCLVPRTWDANPAFLAFLANFESTTALEYFWVTTTLATYSAYTALMKDVKALIEAPNLGVWPANALTAISYAGAWGSNVLTALSWSGVGGNTLATATTTTAHGVTPGNTFTITGCTPAGYNGTWTAAAGTTGETLIWVIPVNPGAESVLGSLAASPGGTVTATTTTAHGVAIGQWFQIAGCLPNGYNGWWQAIVGTTGSTLVYSVAAAVGAESLLGTLVQNQYASSGVPSTEFSRAAGWHVSLSFAPSTSSRGAIYNYSPLSGVTPFPTQGTNALLTTLAASNIEVVGTGAQGGISGAIALGGNFSDGNTFPWWYGIDWTNITSNEALTNAVINGSNQSNPLLLNQDGINFLQSVLGATMTSGISFGLIFGSLQFAELSAAQFNQNSDEGLYAGYCVVNAVPFATYYTLSPSNYKLGLYGGFSVSMTPARGFDNIVVNLNATQFVG